MIFHIVTESAFRSQLSAEDYQPSDLARVGFVHCSNKSSVLPVADDYFSGVTEPLLVLEIDASELQAEVRYEAAAPIAGGGTAHLKSAPIFPHIYGPVLRRAIRGVGILPSTSRGFEWPQAFLSLEDFLVRS